VTIKYICERKECENRSNLGPENNYCSLWGDENLCLAAYDGYETQVLLCIYYLFIFFFFFFF
jgi:hypothetical protein